MAEKLLGLFEKSVDWRQCAAAMQREAIQQTVEHCRQSTNISNGLRNMNQLL
jgi:hypothetical protein